MEKQHMKYTFLLTKLNFFFLVTLIFHVLIVHGFQIDTQARRLMSWRRSKIRSRWINSYQDETWSTEKIVFDSDDDEEELHVGNMEDDLIKYGLPGQPKLNVKFNQYAGYVNVDEKNGRSLFYYFAESASGNASSKPLVLWLNGGPGCSSLGFGAMLELGPFGVKPDGKTLYSRTFAWNKVANVMFLESPAGVGFSYSNTSSDYAQSGDKRTAQDAYRFLVNWFKRFPHYKSRDFYIMGESYAGFYVPELADIIVKSNMLATTNSKIQFKGIMIGNGIMNDVTDEKGQLDYLWSHALISDETHLGIQQHCKTQTDETKICEQFQSTAQTEFGNIDPYNIYGPICPLDDDDSSSSSSSSRRRIFKKNGYDPCEQHYVRHYLNLPQVQKSLHANLPNRWESCSDLTWKDSPSSMFPIYNRLISSGLRILLFSGDVDAVVSVTSTRYSISAMNLTVIKPWHVWHDDTKEVAGYMVVYDGLAFATVRGAGHQVPQFQPRRAFALLNMFFANHF
ncbi:serine carboxypeptidase-like 26 [Solanum lycopersicum]|uniref:serine carboxypeptidase-like 26 n=1 Tax=Solanum lycopersicum TaxID=4081 RepID=UPI000276841A|nr:serine carboxypeptidase-like 26 [Solanum lycopersicum]